MQDNPQGKAAHGPVDPDDKYDQVVRKYHRRLHQDRVDGLVSKDVPLEIHMVHIYRVEKEKLSAASCRVYRNALSRYFLARGTAHAVQALEILSGLRPHDPTLHLVLKAAHAKPPRPYGDTDDARGETCPTLHLAKLLRALVEARSKWATAAAEFFLAGVFTGLRPRAWRGARRVDIAGIPALVLASTGTCDSANPSGTNLVVLHDLTPAQLALVDRHLTRVRKYGTKDQFGRLFEGCRQLIRNVGRRTVPAPYKLPSLDGARTLFRTLAGLALWQILTLHTPGLGSATPRQSPPDDDDGGDDGAPVD
ncbi:hypothetical protein NCCP691_25070 [Noviherbaspirillum aridicola]|uniref:Uncharacterized protein n=2 Tax=Noviherbaspirillum aridicola TaxID=2849687 RepID=A0ABQ4Q5L4_9BURK|nr:hypothetical protein NCCP691_25070 [Noviherbaspirillum aridicola]